MPENIINKKHGIVKNEPCYKFCVKSVLLPERFGVSLAPSAPGPKPGFSRVSSAFSPVCTVLKVSTDNIMLYYEIGTIITQRQRNVKQ